MVITSISHTYNSARAEAIITQVGQEYQNNIVLISKMFKEELLQAGTNDILVLLAGGC